MLTRQLSILIIIISLFTTFPVFAVNWLMVQGTEKKMKGVKASGLMTIDYQRTKGSPLPVGLFKTQPAIFNQISPDLEDNESITARRLQLNFRGWLMPKTNFFINFLGGENGVTDFDEGQRIRPIDASITFNHFPKARLRAGMFKQPIGEEGLKPIFRRHYVNFSDATKQLVLERFFEQDGTPKHIPNHSAVPVSLFRDIGLQLFGHFRKHQWEHAYAVMVGQGYGLTLNDHNDELDGYIYWSSEKVFSGKGPKQQGFKFFGWYQQGKRNIKVGQQQQLGSFDRKRYGIGTSYLKQKWRLNAEYIWADGMINIGTDQSALSDAWSNNHKIMASFHTFPEEKAHGWHIDLGYQLYPFLSANIRYDYLDRATVEAKNTRTFETTTLGLTYQPNKMTRLLINYEFRKRHADYLPESHLVNQILTALDDRIAIQFERRY